MGGMSWGLIGHSWAAELLASQIARQATRQAYLICGPDGVGARTLAVCFAQALNCQLPPHAGQYCGECRACRLIDSMTFPDLHILQGEDGATALKIDQVRQLQHQLALAPFEGRWKIGLLLRFHQATEEAANALLKTLEEPASQVILILTARSPEPLLPTIVSRCELINLRPVAARRLEEALRTKGVAEDQARLLSRLAGGRPGWAIRCLEEQDLLERRVRWLDEWAELLGGTRARRLEYAEHLTRGQEVDQRRQHFLEGLEIWLSAWRDLVFIRLGIEQRAQNIDRLVRMQELAQRMDLSEGLRAWQATEATMERIGKNANLRLSLESLLLTYPLLT
jgi:DNA polymerase III subunit delta'